MKRQELAPSIFTIRDVLTADECQQMIAFAEQRGFDAATINALGVQRLDKDTRNNDRVIDDDFELAKRLWSRVEKFMPRMLSGRPVRGLNERFRYYRYTPGQRFAWHFDGSFARPNGEVSLLTFMIYLNEGYEGGETQFESVSVAGKLGMALVFEHELLHEGAEVTGGIKYVLRSDVMYGPWAKETRDPSVG
jgi:prolyl 4-hydroxylase